MSRLFFVSASALVLICLFPWSAPAAISVQYLGPLYPTPPLGPVPQGNFLLGHAGDPAHLLIGQEIYGAYTRCAVLEPRSLGCTCPTGYTVNSYNFVFAKIGYETVEATMSIAMGHSYTRDAYPPEATCFEPPGGYGSPRYQELFFCWVEESFTVVPEGFYLATISGADLCGCIILDYTQGLHLPMMWSGPWGTQLFMVTDDNPGHCPDYFGGPNMGMFWYQEIDAPGNILMWAEATCCENPVGTERNTWGSLKALFR